MSAVKAVATVPGVDADVAILYSTATLSVPPGTVAAAAASAALS